MKKIGTGLNSLLRPDVPNQTPLSDSDLKDSITFFGAIENPDYGNSNSQPGINGNYDTKKEVGFSHNDSDSLDWRTFDLSLKRNGLPMLGQISEIHYEWNRAALAGRVIGYDSGKKSFDRWFKNNGFSASSQEDVIKATRRLQAL